MKETGQPAVSGRVWCSKQLPQEATPILLLRRLSAALREPLGMDGVESTSV